MCDLFEHTAMLSSATDVCLCRGEGDSPLAIPQALQAQAWAALGKVSLIDETLCRGTAPLMVQQLARSKLPAVRANLLLALADMCMQYTLLVDTHMGEVAATMRDKHPLVRKQALALMALLLKREFVKWRGPLFVQCAPMHCIFACSTLVQAGGWCSN